MEAVFIVVLLALVEFIVLGGLVGHARGAHGVAAPATTGNPAFERVYRTHQNTMEALIVFVPALWIFGEYLSPIWGAGIGVVFLIGRIVYARGYIANAEKRGLGMMISGLANMALVIGALVGVIMSAV